MALYTEGSTIYKPTSQYGDLNILWNCLYRSTFLYIIIALHWSYEPQIPSSNPPENFVKSYWNKFLKVIFLPNNDFSFAFCTFISVICYFIFHYQTISSWFKKLYPGVMSHLKSSQVHFTRNPSERFYLFIWKNVWSDFHDFDTLGNWMHVEKSWYTVVDLPFTAGLPLYDFGLNLRRQIQDSQLGLCNWELQSRRQIQESLLGLCNWFARLCQIYANAFFTTFIFSRA